MAITRTKMFSAVWSVLAISTSTAKHIERILKSLSGPNERSWRASFPVKKPSTV